MTAHIPCITDSDEWRFDPDGEEVIYENGEEQILWLEDDWKGALYADTYESWHDVRMIIYGAKQMLIQINGANSRPAVKNLLDDLYQLSFEYGRICISEGKYEGA